MKLNTTPVFHKKNDGGGVICLFTVCYKIRKNAKNVFL